MQVCITLQRWREETHACMRTDMSIGGQPAMLLRTWAW